MIMTGQGFATGIWWVEVSESSKHFILFRIGTLQKTNWSKMCFPGGATVKNPPVNAGNARDMDLIPG